MNETKLMMGIVGVLFILFVVCLVMMVRMIIAYSKTRAARKQLKVRKHA